MDKSEFYGVTSPDYRVFRLIDSKNNDFEYFKYIMQCCYMCKYFYQLGQGVSNLGRWRLQTETFKNFKIPVPPSDEQKKISMYITEKCKEINSLLDMKRMCLEQLGKYKKSLIYEYVTGKKEVRTDE